MNDALCRPFYAEYAWAFDLLIDRPVEKECGVIAAWLVGREILPGAGVLDAGCGTGRYSRELARRGYIVHGVDRSPELIEVAKGTVGDRTGGVSFAVADILAPPLDTPQCVVGSVKRSVCCSLRHGFGNIQYFGAYNHSVALGATDRLVAVAQLSDDAD
jgi:SAM-dependent methyltransferase